MAIRVSISKQWQFILVNVFRYNQYTSYFIHARTHARTHTHICMHMYRELRLNYFKPYFCNWLSLSKFESLLSL